MPDNSFAFITDRPVETADQVTGAAAPRRPWNVAAATGIGSLPGDSADEAARIVAGELPDLPHLAELPDRGVGADMVGRAIGLLVDIFGEVVPSGWRVSRRPGRDTRRAKDFLAWDLDAAQLHYAGAEWVKVQVCGPWTLAAGIEVPTGNRAVIDPGAVDDLTDSLAEGLRTHVADLQRRLPGTSVVVQIDEPGLPAVLAGSLPTASGFGTVRAIEPARARQVLGRLTDQLAGYPLVVHSCHPLAPLELLRQAGFGAFSLDLTSLSSAAARLDPIGEAVEAGQILLAGLLPTTRPAGPDRPLAGWAAPLLRTFDQLGLSRNLLAGVVPTPTCGLAGADPDWAVQALAICRELARAFQDLPEGW